MSTAVAVTPEAQAESTPQAEAAEVPAFSMNQFFEERDAKASGKPNVDPAPDTSRRDDPLPPSEGTNNGESASATPTSEAATTEASPPKEDGKPQSMPKEEREKFKLREAKRREKERGDKLEKELRELREKYGEVPESLPTDPDPVQVARFEERASLSRERFIQEYGEAELEAQITGADAPWLAIEERARGGDMQALQYQQRVAQSKDPFQEAKNILDEEAMYERYETRNLKDLLARHLAAHGETLEAELRAKHQPPRRETGKEVTTLTKVAGDAPRPAPTEAATTQEFSLGSYFSDRHRS